MNETMRAPTPVLHWVIAVAATLWNLIGPVDYLMTKTRNDAYMAAMLPGVDPQVIYAYTDGFPLLIQVGWAVGVWFALAGSLLLLARHRWAVIAFALSLVGAVVSLGYQLMNPLDVPALQEGSAGVMPYVIIAIAVALLLYARSASARGVLR
jgi:hypothetical protein